MIKIEERPDVPPSLKPEKVSDALQELTGKVGRGEGIVSKDFHSRIWQVRDVKDALWDSQNGKCCFCENKRAKRREFDAEHFRPKGSVHECDKHPGYWWLAYDWSNLLHACRPCNQGNKGTKFPVRGTRACCPEDSLDDENPELINPITENPENYIGFEWGESYNKFVKTVSLDGDGRGNKTIHIAGLNRPELQQERAELVTGLQSCVELMNYAKLAGIALVFEESIEKIKSHTSPKRRFTGFRRAFFRNAGLGEYIVND